MSNINNSIIPSGASSQYSIETGATGAIIENPSADNSAGKKSELGELKSELGQWKSYWFSPEKGSVNNNTSNFSAETQAGNTSCKFNSQVNAGKVSKANLNFTAGNGDRLSFNAAPDSNSFLISKPISRKVTVVGNYAHTNSPENTFSTAGINYNDANTNMFAGYVHTGKNCTMTPQTAAPGSTPIQNYKGLEGPLVSLDRQFTVFRKYKGNASVTSSRYNNDPNLPYLHADLRLSSGDGPSFGANYTRSCEEEQSQGKSYIASEVQNYKANFPLPAGKTGKLSLSAGYERRNCPGFTETNSDTASAGVKYSSEYFSASGNYYNKSFPNSPLSNTSGFEAGVDWKKVHVGCRAQNTNGSSCAAIDTAYSFDKHTSVTYSHGETPYGTTESFGVEYKNPASDLCLGIRQINESVNGQTNSSTFLNTGWKF